MTYLTFNMDIKKIRKADAVYSAVHKFSDMIVGKNTKVYVKDVDAGDGECFNMAGIVKARMTVKQITDFVIREYHQIIQEYGMEAKPVKVDVSFDDNDMIVGIR